LVSQPPTPTVRAEAGDALKYRNEQKESTEAVSSIEQTRVSFLRMISIMSMALAAWYLQKVDQCARLAGEATEPSQRCRLESDRRAWLQILADEIGADLDALEAVIAREARMAPIGSR
jgi:hypothetical protein